MKQAQIVDRVREIVGRHDLPEFITGFEVRLGEFDGDPAMWVVFRTKPGPRSWNPEAERRVAGITAVRKALLPELLEAFDDRFPYFRFESEPDRVVSPH